MLPTTIGELFRTLCEMGFSEEQIQSALQAGHFSVPDAAEWLLQGENLRHKLVKNPSQPVATPFAAFNPPKDAGSSYPVLVLGPPQPSSPSTDTPPLESRIRQDKSDFQEQQRMRVANEARNERRQKKQEHELVLKRIAEDRISLQEKKTQSSTPTETMSPPGSSQGQRLGGTVQTSVEHNCILMIRLPSGESMRERFPADAPLRSVVEHISGRHPSLASFSLLQGFPRKRFGEAELACSLRSLGLMPNAALCIQTTPPETPQDPPSPAARLLLGQEEVVVPPPAPHQPQIPVLEEGGMEDPARPPPLPHLLWEEAVGYAGIPGVGPPVTGPSHSWGRGQKLNPGDAEEAASSEDEELEGGGEPPFPFNGMPRLPFFPENRMEPRHHWPDQGNRLREDVVGDPAVEPEEAAGHMVPGAAGQAAVERLQRAAQDDPQASQGHPSPPKRPFRTPSVPSLCVMATRATVNLMTAPSMQYSSSLSCLTPELAELLLSHMSRERLLRPRTLELFFGCPMQKFVLNCYPYSTNELLRQLRAFTALKHLSLVNSPLITDTGLSVLCSLLKLQHLNLTSCSKLTDTCLQHITGLKSLSFLSLNQTKVSDVGMVLYLQSAPSSLTQLSLNQTSVTEATLAALPAYVPQLRLLSVKHTKVRDVSALAALPSLQTLYLDGTGVREGSLECLAVHSTLSALSLAGISVADGNHALQIISGLKFLKRMHLSQVNLEGSGVTPSGISNLIASCPHITSIRASHTRAIPPDQVSDDDNQ
uniref:Uncharacterized protein n=1 Tax=Oncorhynchus tshawytscha TaxID=74940 RepID=A0A8C8GW50_ONCTS